jgi:hypothetical protein
VDFSVMDNNNEDPLAMPAETAVADDTTPMDEVGPWPPSTSTTRNDEEEQLVEDDDDAVDASMEVRSPGDGEHSASSDSSSDSSSTSQVLSQSSVGEVRVASSFEDEEQDSGAATSTLLRRSSSSSSSGSDAAVVRSAARIGGGLFPEPLDTAANERTSVESVSSSETSLDDPLYSQLRSFSLNSVFDSTTRGEDDDDEFVLDSLTAQPQLTGELTPARDEPSEAKTETFPVPNQPYNIDDEILDAEAQSIVANFAAENRLLLRAVWDLLAERDRQAPVVGMMDPVILKAGPLKKASHVVRGTWKIKYVEIRRGMFSYYEDVLSSQTPSSSTTPGSGSHGLMTGKDPFDGDHHMHLPGAVGQLLRKDIPLDAQSCQCRPVKLHQKALNLAPGGAIFELSTGDSKRLWMAKSREERQAWMLALNHAMVGGSVTRGDGVFGGATVLPLPFSASGSDISDGDVPTESMPPGGVGETEDAPFASLTSPPTSPERKRAPLRQGSEETAGSFTGGTPMEKIVRYSKGSTATAASSIGGASVLGSMSTIANRRSSPEKNDLRQYIKVQSQLRNAGSKVDYIRVLRNDLVARPPLTVPVQWIAKQGFDNAGECFREESVHMSVDQLFRDLRRDSVRINKELYRGDSHPHGAEQIIGALVRHLLAVANDPRDMGGSPAAPCSVSESQAMAYARDILLSGNRTRSGGDSYYTINSLCRNDHLVVIVPNAAVETAPVQIRILKDSVKAISAVPGRGEKSGWIRTRSKLQRHWKKTILRVVRGHSKLLRKRCSSPTRSERPIRCFGVSEIVCVSSKIANRQRRP